MASSDALLKFAIETAGTSEITRKQAEDDLTSRTATIEALNKERVATPERTLEEIAAEVEHEFMARHCERLAQLEDETKDHAMID